MNMEEFVRGISFKCIQPEDPVKIWEMDIYNTSLPDREGLLKESLYDICMEPRLSTFAIGSIINQAVYLMPPEQAYVNVGVWQGFTLLAGMVNNSNQKCIGVDNFSEFNYLPRENFYKRFQKYKSNCHYFYEMDYRQYFQEVHGGPIGVYLYDAAHDYENQLKGLQLPEPYFADNCIIIVDDTNWPGPRTATLDFINNSAHEYKIILEVQTAVFKNPTFWNGIIILRKVS